MRLSKVIILFLFFYTTFLPAKAKQNIDLILNRVIKKQKSIKSARCHFVQKIQIKDENKEKIIKGNFFFLSPQFFRIDYISPEKETLIFNGKEVYTIKNEKVTSYPKDEFIESFFYKWGFFLFPQKIQNLAEWKKEVLNETKGGVSLKFSSYDGVDIIVLISKQFYLPIKISINTDLFRETIYVREFMLNKKVSKELFHL